MAAPSHLSFRQQGAQGLQSVQMMNINRNSKAEDILEEYNILRDEGAFTDLEIVAGGGGGRAQAARRRVHSVVVAASRWVTNNCFGALMAMVMCMCVVHGVRVARGKGRT